MIEQTVEIATKHGAMTTFIAHPGRGASMEKSTAG